MDYCKKHSGWYLVNDELCLMAGPYRSCDDALKRNIQYFNNKFAAKLITLKLISRDFQQAKIISTGEPYKVGDIYAVWAAEPGSGKVRYRITRVDTTGIYGFEISNSIH